MVQPQYGNTKRARLHKDGPVLETPDHASWSPRSMTTSTREDDSSDGVVCPACGRESPTHRGYAIHFSKSNGDGHTGNPTVTRFGRDRLVDLYWKHGYEEIADTLGVGSTTVFNAYDELDLPKKTKYNRVAWKHGVSKERLAYHLHYDAEMTTTEMAEALDVSRPVIDKLFEKSDVEPRSQGEAAELAYEQMTGEERAEMTETARKRQREKYGDGAYIAEWVHENPEKHAEIAKENGHKGAPAREENGMAGVTGQDHPRWRGGKHLIDNLRKQLRPSWWTVRDDERAEECYNCGASDCKLDVHHIVPISAGGTNGSWNLMTLCESCHTAAEWYTRGLPGMEAVLTE